MVIITDNKAVVHSYMVPVVLNSVIEPSKKYLIADGVWTEVPDHISYSNVVWFQKPFKNGKNEAFKVQMDWEVDGSKGKKYKVENYDGRWSCSCPAFGWSGNSRTCKHITKIKTDNGWN